MYLFLWYSIFPVHAFQLLEQEGGNSIDKFHPSFVILTRLAPPLQLSSGKHDLRRQIAWEDGTVYMFDNKFPHCGLVLSIAWYRGANAFPHLDAVVERVVQTPLQWSRLVLLIIRELYLNHVETVLIYWMRWKKMKWDSVGSMDRIGGLIFWWNRNKNDVLYVRC